MTLSWTLNIPNNTQLVESWVIHRCAIIYVRRTRKNEKKIRIDA